MSKFRKIMLIVCLLIVTCFPINGYAMGSEMKKNFELTGNDTSISEINISGNIDNVSVNSTYAAELKVKVSIVSNGNESSIEELFKEIEIQLEKKDGKYSLVPMRNGEYMTITMDELIKREIEYFKVNLDVEVPKNIESTKISIFGEVTSENLESKEIRISSDKVKNGKISAQTFKVFSRISEINHIESDEVYISSYERTDVKKINSKKCKIFANSGEIIVNNLKSDSLFASATRDVKIDSLISHECKVFSTLGDISIKNIISEKIFLQDKNGVITE